MRFARLLVIVLLAGTLAWSESLAYGLARVTADGWHSWQVAGIDGEDTEFFVLIEGGRPVKIRSLNWNCRRPAKDDAIDHGRVSQAESYAWFRAVVEDAAVDHHIRDAALFGLVESGGDDAFDYIDGILSQR